MKTEHGSNKLKLCKTLGFPTFILAKRNFKINPHFKNNSNNFKLSRNRKTIGV